MASRLGLVNLCNLCVKVFDKDRGVWVSLEEYRAYYDEPSASYAFTGTFCDSCHNLYSVMIGIRKETSRVNSSIVDYGHA